MYREKKIKDFPIAADGVIIFIYIAGIALLVQLYSDIAGVVLFLVGLFVLFFFRNPRRESQASEMSVLSPADGKVMSVTEMDEPDFIGGKAVKVTIFLSLFSVHINRSPIDGVVRYHYYRDGKMLPAFKSHASEINERNSIGIESADGFRVLVHQITGFVARRIVWWVTIGESLARGERFGLIKFGSCTEIVMPSGTEIKVAAGQSVRGGITIIGVRKSES
ncbi:MAG: phosphatidylserine decarboxylase family protein [Saccharofermentanales bacterium]